MKIKSIFLATAVLIASLPLTSFGQKTGGPISEAASTVKAFYAFHFQHNFDFSERGLRLKRKWLDESLYKLLLEDRKKAAAAKDEVVGLDGDPFTNSQEPPNSFQVGESKQDDKSASVTVKFFWKDKGKVVDQRKVDVKLAKVANAWKITNIISGDSEDDDLVKLLKHSK
ncbi:MAG TPA: hypothetical protein VLR90_04925 [Blastocatellia bacterium]|nr:hypothetical protein [Blastocatellia bacterium]